MIYHISNSGDDANPGTHEKPWRTLARANAEYYDPGDRILLRCSEIFAGPLILSEQNVLNDFESVTIAAYFNENSDLPTKRPIIEAGEGDAITLRNVSGITIRDLDLRGSGYATNQGFGIHAINDVKNAQRLHSLNIDHVIARGFRWAGIYVGGIPNDLPGFDAPCECWSGFQGVTITKCEAFGNMYYGIYVSGPLRPDMTEYANTSVTITHCKTYDNPGDKYYTANHSGSGILLDNCQVGRIEYCESWNNGAENAGQNGGPCGIWSHASDRITIAHCRSYANRTGGAADGTGFDFDGGVTNSVMEYCESWDNDGPGYLMWNYENAPFTLSGNIIRDCVSTNDGRKHRYGSVHLGTSGEPIFDIYIRNCTITQSPAPNGALPACLQVEGKHNENIVFRGNKITTSGNIPETRFPEGATGITVAP